MGMPCFCYVLKIDNFIGGGDNEGRRNMRRKSNEKEYGL